MFRPYAKQLLIVGCSAIVLLAGACAQNAQAPAATTAPSKPAAQPAPAAPTTVPAAKPTVKFPSKPVIFVAPGSVGGGADTQARLAADAIEKAKLIQEPVAVLNKGAGGAQEAFSFMKSKKGDPHYLMTTANLFLTYPMLGQAAYELKDFIPIANLVFDPTVIIAPANSKYNSLKDVIEAAKAAPETITISGGPLGSQDHMALLALQEAAGFKLKFVAFSGGGESHRAVLGNQVELAVGNPSDFLSSLEAKKLKGLANLDSERSPVAALKDIPTAKEQGYNVNYVVWRGWFAPAGIDKETVGVLEGFFKKVVESKDFQDKYVNQFGMRTNYMPSAEFSKYLDGQTAEYEKLLTKGGVLKK